MSGKAPRITIVSYNWPPRNAIGTHRPYAWAKAWAALGAQVTVLTAQKQAFDVPLDLDLPPLEDAEVIEVPYTLAANLLDRGLMKSLLLKRLAKSVKQWIKANTSISIDPRSGWRAAATGTVASLAFETDIVVSTYGPAGSHLIAHDMKKVNPVLRWIADYRDLWSQSPTNVSEANRKRDTIMEMSTVRGLADHVTAVSEDMVEKLAELTDKPASLVPNGFDIDDEVVRNTRFQTPVPDRRPIRLVYTGTVSDRSRDPEPLLHALATLREQGTIAVGDVTVDFYGSRLRLVEQLVKNADYAPFVRVFGHVPRSVALDAQKKASLLLLLESSAPEAKGVLTGKIFEYMVSGRPIICIGSRNGYEIDKALRSTGTGLVLDGGADRICEYFINLLNNSESALQFFQPRLHNILKYSRKTQATKMYHDLILDQAMT